MRWHTLALALAFATLAVDTEAAGTRGFGGSRGAAPPAAVGPQHFHGGGTRVFVGGTFFVGPHPYYYWPGYWPGYYYGAPVMAAPVSYWYYCAPLAAYYPYVPDCPGGWQLVEPYPY
jgi:hypothetical protein